MVFRKNIVFKIRRIFIKTQNNSFGELLEVFCYNNNKVNTLQKTLYSNQY